MQTEKVYTRSFSASDMAAVLFTLPTLQLQTEGHRKIRWLLRRQRRPRCLLIREVLPSGPTKSLEACNGQHGCYRHGF